MSTDHFLLFLFCPTASDHLTLTVNSMTSLQQAIDIASSLGNTAAYTKIQIPPGNHLLTAPTLFRGEINEIEMTGAGGGEVRLLCNYSVGSNNYTWYFAGLQSVMLTGIGFEDCARPLRLDTVAEVTIQDCSFRYVCDFNRTHLVRIPMGTEERVHISKVSSFQGSNCM